MPGNWRSFSATPPSSTAHPIACRRLSSLDAMRLNWGPFLLDALLQQWGPIPRSRCRPEAGLESGSKGRRERTPGMQRHFRFAFALAEPSRSVFRPRVEWSPSGAESARHSVSRGPRSMAYLIALGVREHEHAGQRHHANQRIRGHLPE